jgi:uncharacterized protein YegL
VATTTSTIKYKNIKENYMTLETSVEFAENPEPRCACVLLLDTSGSMGGAPIAALNEGLITFKDVLSKDPVASKRVEIAIVTFDSSVKLLQDFVTIEQFTPPVISDLGAATLMSAGINMALDLVHNRKAQYRSSGVAYYQPWIFMITDGAPTESDAEVQSAGQRVKEAETNRRLSFYAVGVEGADMEKLRSISSVRDPVKLKGLDFKAMFVWLSASMQKVSASKVGQQVPLQPVGWASVG